MNFTGRRPHITDAAPQVDATELEGAQRATFAAGCFWGVEAAFRETEGVVRTSVGYTGGSTHDPSYEQVCSGATGHAEAVDVWFDPTIVSYGELLEMFWSIHDPTTRDRQGWDFGSQYRALRSSSCSEVGAPLIARLYRLAGGRHPERAVRFR